MKCILTLLLIPPGACAAVAADVETWNPPQCHVAPDGVDLGIDLVVYRFGTVAEPRLPVMSGPWLLMPVEGSRIWDRWLARCVVRLDATTAVVPRWRFPWEAREEEKKARALVSPVWPPNAVAP